MADITYDKISIMGIEYSKLINIEIHRRLNEHANAIITCEISKEEKQRLQTSINDGNLVTITTASDGDYDVLFVGVKYNLQIEESAEYYVAKLELKSTSYLLDVEKHNKTWQNGSKLYSAVMGELIKGRGIIRFNITDKSIGGFWMQKNETDWNMLLRFASGCGTSIVPNVKTEIPIIDVGIPGEITSTNELGYMDYLQGASPLVIGTDVTINKGVLETTCITGRMDAYKQNRITCEAAAGKMYTGVVQKIEKQKVQVFFDNIDAEYDADGNTWFEYSATYAGTGEKYKSGIYFMPEVGDRVRVFFPDGDGGEGFAFASETGYVLDNPSKVSWRAPGGQEILFTNTGIRISGKDNSVYIDLLYDDGEAGIQITCDTDIQMSTHKNEESGNSFINIEGKEEILIGADNQILLETPETSLEMNKEKIILNAEYVYMQ